MCTQDASTITSEVKYYSQRRQTAFLGTRKTGQPCLPSFLRKTPILSHLGEFAALQQARKFDWLLQQASNCMCRSYTKNNPCCLAKDFLDSHTDRNNYPMIICINRPYESVKSMFAMSFLEAVANYQLDQLVSTCGFQSR